MGLITSLRGRSSIAHHIQMVGLDCRIVLFLGHVWLWLLCGTLVLVLKMGMMRLLLIVVGAFFLLLIVMLLICKLLHIGRVKQVRDEITHVVVVLLLFLVPRSMLVDDCGVLHGELLLLMLLLVVVILLLLVIVGLVLRSILLIHVRLLVLQFDEPTVGIFIALLVLSDLILMLVSILWLLHLWLLRGRSYINFNWNILAWDVLCILLVLVDLVTDLWRHIL